MGQQRRPQQPPRRRQRVHRHNGRGRRGVPAEGRGDAERDAARERARPHAERGGVVAEGGVGGGGERGVDGPPMRDRPGPGRRAVRERRQSERAEVAAGAVDGGRGAAGGEAVAEVQAEGEGRGVAEGDVDGRGGRGLGPGGERDGEADGALREPGRAVACAHQHWPGPPHRRPPRALVRQRSAGAAQGRDGARGP